MMKSNQPLVSICIPTYNSSRFLRDTLESVAAQTWPNCEVIISDNASTDDTLAIAQPFVERFGWRLLTSESNDGPFCNWNRLVESATGEYLAIYHADDLYNSRIVAESVAILERSPDVGLVGTLAKIIDSEGREKNPVMIPKGVLPSDSYSFPELFRAVLRNGGDRIMLVTPSIMVRRRLYLEMGGFDTTGCYASAGDYEMWLRIAAGNKVAVIPESLVSYRIHQGQGSELELRRNLDLPDLLAVLKKYAPLVNDHDIQQEYHRYCARSCFKTALKQNCVGRFSRSSETTGAILCGPYLLLGAVLMIANRFRINLRYWPGKPWPSRISLGDE